jgi:hypothetical protein
MFAQTINYPVFYIPREVGYPQSDEFGLGWLEDQPGPRSILVLATGNVSSGTVLGRRPKTVQLVTVRTHARSFAGGAVLAPHPRQEVILTLVDEMAAQVTALCVIEGDSEFCQAWLTDVAARDVEDDALHVQASPIDPVALYALQRMSEVVNHGNGLVTDDEKGIAIGTLEELRRGGLLPTSVRLAAWAAANGFTKGEVRSLVGYAEGGSCG